jgi:hypothetical protein
MRGNLALFIAFSLAANLASAAPISVAGFTFDDGERAFADDAFLASGSGVRFNCTAGGTAASSFADALSGSDVTQCVNVSGGGDGIVEVVFTDNSIQNEPGPDLVIFEVSGPQTTGTADPRERFEVSIFDGSGFSSFMAYDPIATGFGTPDPTLDVFAVEIDLSLFGIAAGERVDRLRLHLFDNGLGSKGADIAALGALHSAVPIPEPSTILLVAAGLAGLAIGRGRGFSRRPLICLGTCAALVASAAPPADALLIETFDTDTADATGGSYPEFTLNVGSASVHSAG